VAWDRFDTDQLDADSPFGITSDEIDRIVALIQSRGPGNKPVPIPGMRDDEVGPVPPPFEVEV
jgi:hypothetical protein